MVLERNTIYKTLKCSLHAKTMEDKINELAKEGWKLITSSVAQDGPFLIFTKQVEPVDNKDKVNAILNQVNNGQAIRNPNAQ